MKKLLVIGLWVFGFSLSAQDIDTVQTEENSFAAFPAFSYAPETSAQFGAVAIWVLKNEDLSQSLFQRQSTLTPYFVYTLRRQVIAVTNLDYYFPKGQNLDVSARYYFFPDFYFGIGNDNDIDESDQYSNRFFQLDGEFFIPQNSKTFLGFGFDAHFTSIEDFNDGGMLEMDDPIGINGGNLFGFGPAYRFDTRNNVIYPSKGHYLFTRSLFNYLGDFDYTSWIIDARKYISLWNEDNILAFQFRSAFTFGDNVPFFKLPQLGGDERLRGISNASLYRDKQMMYTQVEYRRPLFWRFGMTVFAGVGDVAPGLEDFDLSEFKYVAGVGGRLALIPNERLNARLDIGISSGGGAAIYIGLREAF